MKIFENQKNLGREPATANSCKNIRQLSQGEHNLLAGGSGSRRGGSQLAGDKSMANDHIMERNCKVRTRGQLPGKSREEDEVTDTKR